MTKHNMLRGWARRLALPVLAASTAFALSGCRAGGGVTSAPSGQAPAAIVSAPIIALPATTPFYSKADQLTLSGICATGSAVFLTGASTDSQNCANGTFSFTIEKTVDGIYTFLVTQANSAQYYSNPAVMVWVRKSSVAPVILTSPTTNPFYSGTATLNISGICETGAVISLSGGGAGSTTCANSAFSIVLPKAADGDYNISVNQTDGAGNVATVSFEWRRHTLHVSPGSTGLVVSTPTELTISGGSGEYTVSISQNNSGAALDSGGIIYSAGPTGKIGYTPGPLANVIDKVTITDTYGNNVVMSYSTVAGAADHFVLVASSGNEQTAYIGTPFANPVRVKVVDFNGNGIPATPVYFQTMFGDAVVTSQPIVVTDASGIAEATIRAGYQAVINGISASSIGGDLPDLGATGKGSITLTAYTQTKNSGAFGSTFAVGANPGTSITGDFNGDGFLDVAILNITDSKVGILLGAAGGSFKPMVAYPVCSGPTGITSGSFIDTPARTDFVVICGSGKYSLMRGVGDGTFSVAAPVSFPGSLSLPTAIVSADFNGDGRRDFAIAAAGGGLMAVYFGDGLGGFVSSGADQYTIGQTPSAMKVIDSNHVGRVDIAIAYAGENRVGLFRNKGNGKFDPHVKYDVGPNPVALAVFQANDINDAYDDLVTVNDGDGSITVLKNDQSGGFERTDIPVGNNPSSVAVADFNKDGHMDLAVTNSGDGTVSILHNDGDAHFAPVPAISTAENPVYISVADVDKDTNQDLLITSAGSPASLQVLLGHPGGSLFGLITDVSNGPSAAAFVDFDGDGIQDALVVNSGQNTVSVLKGKGNGFFTSVASKATSNNPTAIVVGDFNKDGKVDFVVANQTSGTLLLYTGDGAGGFTAGSPIVVGSQPKGLITADMNRDGVPDLITANANGTVSVFLNSSSTPGTFTRQDNVTGSGPLGLAVGDFNGDHKLDIATISAGADAVYILLGNADGTLRAPVQYLLDNGVNALGPAAITTADLNNDGYSDVIVANGIEHSISVLIANPNGTLKNPVNYEAGSTPVSLVLGDFNHDNKLDVAVANGAARTFTIIKGNGNGTFSSAPNTFTLNFHVGGMISGDFNADSNLDLMLFDTYNQRVQLWQGQ